MRIVRRITSRLLVTLLGVWLGGPPALGIAHAAEGERVVGNERAEQPEKKRKKKGGKGQKRERDKKNEKNKKNKKNKRGKNGKKRKKGAKVTTPESSDIHDGDDVEEESTFEPVAPENSGASEEDGFQDEGFVAEEYEADVDPDADSEIDLDEPGPWPATDEAEETSHPDEADEPEAFDDSEEAGELEDRNENPNWIDGVKSILDGIGRIVKDKSKH